MGGPINHTVEVMQRRADNLRNLNVYLSGIDDLSYRKRTIMALWEAEVISETAADLLIEHHGLEAE